MAYKDYSGVEVRIARIFNTYGPFMDPKDGRVVSNFIVQALQNSPLTVYGDGSQTRSFCYVEDQVDGLIRLMNSDYQYPVNIGNPFEINMLELANLVGENCGLNIKIENRPLPTDDPVKRCPDISMAKEIEWEPADISTGLTEYSKLMNNFKNKNRS